MARSQQEEATVDGTGRYHDHRNSAAVAAGKEVREVAVGDIAEAADIGAVLARNPNDGQDMILLTDADRDTSLPSAVVAHKVGSDFPPHFVNSRDSIDAAAHTRIPSCQSYCVLPPPRVVRLVAVPKILLGYRSQKGTNPVAEEHSSPAEALHREDSLEDLLLDLRSRDGDEVGAGVVRSSWFLWG